MPSYMSIIGQFFFLILKTSSVFFRPIIFNTSALLFYDGIFTWWKSNLKVKDHENSATHQEAFIKWQELEMGLKAGTTVDSLGQNKLNNVLKKWVQILHRVVKMIRFLSKQNLPFRGHVETIKPNDTSNNSGNFIELTKLLSNYDPVLREHIVRCQYLTQGQQSYLSPQIQNELIDIMG